jgi:hypothetical protein
MTPEDIRAFAERPWGLLAALKLEFVAERYRKDGPNGARRAARRLAERWASLHPDGPSPESRDLDFSGHVALKSRLDRAGLAIRRR